MKNRFTVIVIALLAAASCIRNDIPYPDVAAEITSLRADGAKSVSIGKDAREVLVTLEEVTDIRGVNITEVTFNEDAVTASAEVAGVRDLSSPLKVTLSLYERDFEWTVKAVQPIERYFTVSGQSGDSVIDPDGRRVTFKIPSGADLSDLNVASMKLGPENYGIFPVRGLDA